VLSSSTLTLSSSLLPPPPTSTLFPYTTLFRSLPRHSPAPSPRPGGPSGTKCGPASAERLAATVCKSTPSPGRWICKLLPQDVLRSEEHTSELQSRENLVCRLLLEKKKKKTKKQ